MPQRHLEHKLLTASATVDGSDVTMLSNNGSYNAIAPFTVVNTRGFDLPQTGSRGTWMYPVIGLSMLALCVAGIVLVSRKKLDT
jgi:LPXTG-motif cell wall-anchored protein